VNERRLVDAPVRLALRVEGKWWVAYIARIDNMKGALEMGRILVKACKDDIEVEAAFKDCMSKLMVSRLRMEGLEVARMDQRPAPESERSGNS
jgi:hypothetical protein